MQRKIQINGQIKKSQQRNINYKTSNGLMSEFMPQEQMFNCSARKALQCASTEFSCRAAHEGQIPG